MTSTPSPLDLADNRRPRERLEDAREKPDRLLAEEITVEADDRDDAEEFARERLTEFRDEANS